MNSRARRILPALVLASVLPLSLSACEGDKDNAGGGSSEASPSASKDPGKGGGADSGKTKPSADPGDGEGGGDDEGTDVGPCDDKAHLETKMSEITDQGDTGSAVISITNTGSGPCVLPKVLDLAFWDENEAQLDLDVNVFNPDSEVALGPDGIASAEFKFNTDPDAAPVDAGELNLDGIGKLAVDPPGGETLTVGEGTAQLVAFEASN